jgi:hypothetical protein
MNRYAPFLLLAGLLAVGCQKPAGTIQTEGSADRSAPSSERPGAIEIPRGTQFYVRVDKTLDSAKAKQGDLVEGILNSSIVAGGREVLPVGTKLGVRITNSQIASAPASVGLLTLNIETIHHGGANYDVKAAPVTVETSQVEQQVDPNKQIPHTPLTEKQGRANAVLRSNQPLLFETTDPIFVKP